MRIAQIAPLYEAVPPKLYGGTERVVSYLTEALVDLGHDVTLFASGDSVTSARLEAAWPRALRLDPSIRDSMAPHMRLLEKVARVAHEFDVLHFHLDYLPFPLMSRLDTPYVTTLHGRLDLPELQPVFDAFPDSPVVSISNNQRKPLPQAAWAGTVYHGLPDTLLTPQPGVKPEYLAFLGRICPEKRVDTAIRIAAQSGLPLKIAAKVDKADADYFKEVIEPLLDQAHVEFIGEINEAQKPAFLSGAKALLFPIDWPEPFGLVMDDRGDGLRHAGRRVQPRLGARSDRGRRDRLHRRGRAGRGRRAAPDRQPVAHRHPRTFRYALQLEGHGAAICRNLRIALHGARQPALRRVAGA